MDESDSSVCPVVEFSVGIVETLGSTTRVN
jgi:hypothetical protein